MLRWIIFATMLVPHTVDCQVNFIATLNSDTTLAKSIGFRKLTQSEQTSLNSLLNRIYELGRIGGLDAYKSTSPSSSAGSTYGYESKIDEDEGDILKLDNGAIVEVSGYLGYIGYRKDCILYKTGSRWKMWIEGKRSFSCEVLKTPDYGRKINLEELYLSEVKGDGSILLMGDGSMYEVSSINTIDTGLWIGGSNVLLLDSYRLINLDEGGEIIDVTKIR